MTDPSVRTELPERERGAALKKRVDELLRHDWIAPGEIVDGTAEVLHVEPYQDDDGQYRAQILFRAALGAGPEPKLGDLPASMLVELATADEIAAERQDRRREQVTAQLRGLAELIDAGGLPVGDEFEVVRVAIRVAGADQLAMVAKDLDLPVQTGGSMSTVTWPHDGRDASFSPVQAMWHAYSLDVAADPLGLGYSREAEPAVGTAQVPTYVQGEPMSGRGAVAEHYEKSGWRDDLGDCGVECACGIGFDGFASLAEASALLRQHIADEIGHADGATVRLPGPAGQVERYYTFSPGDVDPDTREDLSRSYVTVAAPTAEACRDAMFASRYGNQWAWEFTPGTANWQQYAPSRTEHERLVVDPT